MRAAVVAACSLWACSSGEHAPAGITRTRPATLVPASTDAASAAPSAAAPTDAPKWDSVKLEDAVPLCVFAGHAERGEASFVRDVRSQTLHANARVVFGTFAPGCENEACDSPPTHQCWVESEEPNTLVVHSRLSFEHKRGTTCTTDCRPVAAGCETSVLKPGRYTIKYGARSFSLRVPSVLHAPCFRLE